MLQFPNKKCVICILLITIKKSIYTTEFTISVTYTGERLTRKLNVIVHRRDWIYCLFGYWYLPEEYIGLYNQDCVLLLFTFPCTMFKHHCNNTKDLKNTLVSHYHITINPMTKIVEKLYASFRLKSSARKLFLRNILIMVTYSWT